MSGSELIFGIAFPLTAGALVAWTTRHYGPDGPASNRWAVLLQVFAIALGWSFGQNGFMGGVQYPIVSSDGLLRMQVMVVCAISLIGGALLIHRKWSDRLTPSVMLAAIIAAASVLTVVWLRLRAPDEAGKPAYLGAIFVGAVSAALMAWPLVKMAGENRRITIAAILAGITAASAAGLLGTGSESVARLTVGLALVCVGMLATIIFVRSAAVAVITIAAVCGGLAGPRAAGMLFSSMPLWLALLLAVAPMCGYLAGKLLGERGGPALGAAVRIGVPALVAAAGIAPGIIALIRFVMGEPDASDHGY